MSAPKGNKNSLGNSGGKVFNDPKLAAEIRQLALSKIKKILKGEDSDFQRQILLRLATNVLPRLKEVSGEEGRPLTISFHESFRPSITGMQNIDESKYQNGNP